MVWLDLEAAGIDVEEFIKAGVTFGLAFMGARLVVHYQISDEAVRRLSELLRFLLLKNERLL